MTRFPAVHPHAVRARWHRWKFHLAGLLLVAPLAYAPNFVTGGQYADPGRCVLGPRDVGLWTAILAEPAPGPPKRDAAGRLVKDYTVILCPGCAGAVRTAHLHVRELDAHRTAGVLLHGIWSELAG
jgi:hypothetical protein